MRSDIEYLKVLNLLKLGNNMKEVSRQTGIPYGTIKTWKNRKSPIIQTKADYIRAISNTELQKIINISSSISDMLRFFKCSPQNKFYFDLLKERINNNNLDCSFLAVNKRNKYNYCYKMDLDLANNTIFIKNSNSNRSKVKRYVLYYKLIEYKCSECNNIGFFNNKILILDLDHINGDHNDNRLSNLRFLCPNCHSQQPTSNRKKLPVQVWPHPLFEKTLT